MAKWKIILGTCGPNVMSETVSAKTKEDAVRKFIDRLKVAEYDNWKMELELSKMRKELTIGESTDAQVQDEFSPQPESYWAERYESLLRSTIEYIPKQKS